ncbi:ion transporter [Azospirillum sp. A39]|uniref:ion transporter n=1 Tax=Azospirillum sp. A39 TaxID=3462279 RepID=UPI0040464BD3
MTDRDRERRAVTRRRLTLLHQLEDWLETPMIVLGLLWLVLLAVELTEGLSPFLETVGTAIWALFVGEFLLRFALAPDKLRFLGRNILTLVSLAVPALRLLRGLRVLRLARGLRLVRVLGSLNRGVKATRAGLGRRGFGTVVAVSLVLTLVGAAGMTALERGQGGPFDSYSESLWWTARIMMTIGPEAWPVTPEGRVLSLVLALYGYVLFGYVAASLTSLFVGRDAEDPGAEVAGAAQIRSLEAELRALRAELREDRDGRG